ncbi:hypothetical protein VTG60DRAFT_3180 [Thermothelomyces hinnuleus]
MALLPDWLLRLRRVEPADNPVLAVEKLNSLARPLQDADKEILVGAVLTMSSSLHLALDMLQEILPQEKSQERLGEVMCPTLGSLLDSLQSTLCSFARSTSRQAPPEASATPPASTPGPATPRAGANAAGEQHHHLLPTPRSRHSGHGGRAAVKESEHFGSAGFSRPQTARTETERFPPFEDSRTAGRLDHIGIDIRRRPAEHLVNALQAEMRVQAAINVAIESLEFAEGQLKMVKEVNRLHGGNFDLLQRHFYQGYNRLLSRALELQWREMGLQSSRDSLISVASVEQPCPQLAGHAATTTNNTGMRASPRQHSISFQSVSSVQSPASTTRGYGEARTTGFQRRPLERRNTIQGIRQEVSGNSRTKPPLRRRMSLADELAMVGEDSESGYQDETSEMASSASEFGAESDLKSCSNHRSASERQDESEEHSIYGESTGYESAFENPNEEGDGDRTLNGLDTDSGGLNARFQSIIRPSIE